MASVFLSYSREDRAKAQQVVAALEAGGVSVWWDGLIEGGERFSQATEAALDDADVVVVLWSKTSVKSHWVHDEATRGRDRGRLVPASIDGAAPPLGFGQFQALDLSKWKGKADAPEIAALLRAIAIAVGQPQTAQPASPNTMPGPSRRSLLIGGGATAALATGGVAAWQLGLFAPKAETNSVAVLPFRNLSGDPGQDYFAEGIAEEIRNTLARNPLLKVIATASSAASRSRDAGLGQIAQQLGVENILDGSVRRAGDIVRITVQLVAKSSGAAVWTEKFDRAFADVLRLQSEISEKVLQVLNIQFSGAGYSADAIRSDGGTDNPAAFDEFLKGRAAFERFNVDGFNEAIEHFRQARAIDPRYAAAFAGEARCTEKLTYLWDSSRGPNQYALDGLALAQKGAALAPDAPFPKVVLATCLQNNLRIRDAYPLFQKAYSIAPRSLDVAILYGLFMLYDGAFAEANEAFAHAISVDPLNPRVLLSTVSSKFFMGEMEQMVKAWHILADKFPDFASRDGPTYYLFGGQLALGNYAAARKTATMPSDAVERSWRLAVVETRQGNTAHGVEWIKNAERAGAASSDMAYNIYVLQTWIGQHDEAIHALKNRFALRRPELTTAAVDPLLEPLRKHPEFQALMRKIGFTKR